MSIMTLAFSSKHQFVHVLPHRAAWCDCTLLSLVSIEMDAVWQLI